MKILYTTKPGEHCYEVEPGIYGRPTHTTEQPKLRKQGWVDSVNQLKESDDGLRKEEGREEKEVKRDHEREGKHDESVTINDDRDAWAELYKEKFGKAPHHKAKLETIIAKVESDD